MRRAKAHCLRTIIIASLRYEDEGDIILIKIKNSVAVKLPKLDGQFEFNLLTETTNASKEEVAEI